LFSSSLTKGAAAPFRFNQLHFGAKSPFIPLISAIPRIRLNSYDLKTIDPLLLVLSKKFVEENPEAAEKIRAVIEANRDDKDNQGFFNQQLAIGRFNCYDRLPEIKAETLVFAPKYDVIIPPANGCLIATQIRHSHFVFLEESAHPMIEDVDFMVKKISEFLAG
jgi:hypothetical protein